MLAQAARDALRQRLRGRMLALARAPPRGGPAPHARAAPLRLLAAIFATCSAAFFAAALELSMIPLQPVRERVTGRLLDEGVGVEHRASNTRSFFRAPRVDARFLADGLRSFTPRAFSISLGSAFLPSSLRTLAQETCSSCLCQVNSSALTHRRVNLFRAGKYRFLPGNSWPVLQGVCGCEVNAGHPHSLQTFGVGPYTAHTTVIDLLRLVRGEGARSYFPRRASR